MGGSTGERERERERESDRVTVTAFSLPGESPSAFYSLFRDLPSSSSSSSSSSPAGVPECVCCAPVIGAAMLLIGCVLLAVCSAAPPAHINRLALFPDKSAWCEAKNITQIVGHTGCVSQSIQNRACLGQCFSYSVPNTFPQSTESLVHCDSCKPAQTQWEVVTLECPGSVEAPRVEKLVERILHCSCQSCSKELGQEGALLQLYSPDNTLDPDTHNTHNSHNTQLHTDTHNTHTLADGDTHTDRV